MAAKQIQLTKLCMNRFHFEWALPTYVSSDGFLGSTVPCFQSASSIFRYRKCPSVHRVYSGVSRGPPSSKRWLLLLLSRSEFHRRPHPSRPRASRLQVCRKESEKTGSARPQSSVMFLN